jgi:pyruvate dehydrogenase E2 component (dihydrolipoamide acetyltransferase)
MTEVLVPDLGDAVDVTVIELHVKPGDTIRKEDPIVTLESDKASMDVPSPVDGVVEQVLVAVGDLVEEGSRLLEVAAGDGAAAAPAEGEEAPTEPEAPAEAEPKSAAAEPVTATEPEPAPEPVAVAAATPEAAAAPSSPAPAVHASPLARRVARELDVDLAAVPGTARDGRISKEDVLAHASGSTAAPAAAPPLAGLPPWPEIDFAQFGPVETVPRTRIQKLVAANLHRNWVHIPHVTQHDEADVTELEAFRVQMNEEHADKGVKVTMVSLLMKACVAALREHPEFNSSLAGDELVLKRYYHLGIAVDTERGLVVPVVRDVDRKGLLELAGELAEVSGRARAGKLTLEDIQGGTFTISSLGGIGGTAFTPIVNAPEVAILGVSRSAMKPVWNGERFGPRLMLPLSLSYDHRVIDGAAAARFTRTLASVLEDIRRALV